MNPLATFSYTQRVCKGLTDQYSGLVPTVRSTGVYGLSNRPDVTLLLMRLKVSLGITTNFSPFLTNAPLDLVLLLTKGSIRLWSGSYLF